MGNCALPAALATITFAALLPAQQPAEPKQSPTLQGRIVNATSGDPIRKARIRLTRRRADSGAGFYGYSDAQGEFRFQDIPPGEYDLEAEKPAFLTERYESPLAITEDSDLKDLLLKLRPAASISGRVVDEDGDPVPAAEITLWQKQRILGKTKLQRTDHNIRTDLNGEYRVDDLWPGRYLVSAEPSLDSRVSSTDTVVDSKGTPQAVRDVFTYHPNALSIEEAEAIALAFGQSATGIDVRMRRSKTFKISGRVAGFENIANAGDHLTVWRTRSGELESAKINAKGEFAATGLVPGEYHVSLGGTGMASAARAEVNITDSDRTGIVLKPFVVAQVKLRISVEGQKDKPLAFAFGYLAKDPLNETGFNRCDLQDGLCIFRNVEPGKYLLNIRMSGRYYVKSIRAGDRSLSPTAVEIPEGSLDLDVVMSDAYAQISGEMIDTNTPLSIALVPIISAEDLPPLPSTTSTNQNGQFLFDHVEPGKYRLFATQEIDYFTWTDPDFLREMESNGTEIEVHPREKVSVQLRPIPKEETKRILEKLAL